MADTIKTAKAIRESGRENLRKVSISRIKKEMMCSISPTTW